MTEIKMIKSSAQSRIETHVYEGKHLSEKLTYDNLPKTKEEFVRWANNVLSDLSRMFSDKTLANEFLEGTVIPFNENDSHVDEKNRLADTFDRQLKWLAALAKRVKDFPQAHNTPVISRGR